MTVMWTSDEAVDGVVRYGAGGRLTKKTAVRPKALRYPIESPGWRAKASDVPAGGIRRAFVYAARLTGLTPETTYEYEVRFNGRVERGTFQTFPAGGERITFAVYSDSHCGVERQRRITRRITRHKPLFVIHGGDMISHDHYPEYLRCFFTPAGPMLRHVPIWTARGNHQGGGACWRRLFTPPRDHYYYSFDCGHAHFVCLDSCAWRWPDADEKLAAMADWLDRDLSRSKKPWKIVYYHEPSYDMGWRRTDWGREQFTPILRRHGVDLVFSGHCHSYMRFRPMFWRGENDEHPITYIVNGGGGGGPTTPRPARPHLAVGSRKHHYVLYHLDADRLTAKAISMDGETIDEFAIDKQDGRLDAKYLARAVPEEAFANIEFSLREIRIPAPLKKGETFELPLKLFAGSRAAKFDLRLAPGSAKRFELIRPVRGTIAPNKTKSVVVGIRATGPIRDRSPRSGTRPQFIIECHYEVDGFRGMVSSNVANWRL